MFGLGVLFGSFVFKKWIATVVGIVSCCLVCLFRSHKNKVHQKFTLFTLSFFRKQELISLIKTNSVI